MRSKLIAEKTDGGTRKHLKGQNCFWNIIVRRQIHDLRTYWWDFTRNGWIYKRSKKNMRDKPFLPAHSSRFAQRSTRVYQRGKIFLTYVWTNLLVFILVLLM